MASGRLGVEPQAHERIEHGVTNEKGGQPVFRALAKRKIRSAVLPHASFENAKRQPGCVRLPQGPEEEFRLQALPPAPARPSV